MTTPSGRTITHYISYVLPWRPRVRRQFVTSGHLLSLIACLLCGTACALFLVGCLGSSSGPRTYVADDGQPTIVCLGDSLTAGDAAPAAQSYPAWLQRRLSNSGYRYRVVNAGVSGNRVADGLARLTDDVLRFNPAIVVVELGSNDPGVTAQEQWERQLSALVARIQARGPAVILGGLDEPGLAPVYRRIAAQRKVPLIWFTDGLWRGPGLWGDAHHPNGQGYRTVMEAFWTALVPLLHRG